MRISLLYNSYVIITVMFNIKKGATLTIIDSSDTGKGDDTGEIYINAYMIQPYRNEMRRYTTRDLFQVDGNLVIYGGTYQAGRSKAQSDDKLFDKIKTVVGNATTLATDIAGYATGINSATGAYEDTVFNAKQALDAIKKQEDADGEEGKKTQDEATTNKKDGSDAEKEKKQDNPASEASGEKGGRNQTVGEKQESKDDSKKNKPNEQGTAQYDGNSKIAEAENAITNAAVNKDKIDKMVDSAFSLASSIKKCFETDQESIVTQSLLGTVVNVGNSGTFVSYGGKYIGYGMTPNIRNGVVEVATQGKAYIYDGLFEGRCGANIFNIVTNNSTAQEVTQYVQSPDGTITETTEKMIEDETGGLEIIKMVKKTDKTGKVVTDENGDIVKDYTPVQWVNAPQAGQKVTVQIVNGQAGLIDYQKRKIFDVYYQWYVKNDNGEDTLIAGTDNIFTKKLESDPFKADLKALSSHTFRQMNPGKDGFTYVNTVDPSDPKASTYGENGLPASTTDWTVDMLHAYIESNTPNSWLSKDGSDSPSLSNNRTMATGTDTVYIPKSLEGKTIYCKVTAVNNFWLRNYDHVQVFYSHPATIPVTTKPLTATLSENHMFVMTMYAGALRGDYKISVHDGLLHL